MKLATKNFSYRGIALPPVQCAESTPLATASVGTIFIYLVYKFYIKLYFK